MHKELITLVILSSFMFASTNCNLFLDKLKNKAHQITSHGSKLKDKMKWLKHHSLNGGFKKFQEEFKNHHDLIKKFIQSPNHGKPFFHPHPHHCHHFPKMPFMHRPVYPFMPHPISHLNTPIHMPMNPMHSFFHNSPVPTGVTEVHFLGQFQKTSPGTLLLSNGKSVPVTKIESITVEIDFRVDNKLLERMRDQFAAYHRKWMMALGGIMGGFKAMMPFLAHHCKHKQFHHLPRFPMLLNKLVRLHQMISRHQALMSMLQDAKDNQNKIHLLEQKLSMMNEKFANLKNKMQFLDKMNNIKDKKIGNFFK